MDLRRTRTIRSSIEIDAPLLVVWRVLTDFASYPEWNPIVRRLHGNPRAGGRVTISSQPPGARALVHRPRILAWSPPHELRWRATVLSERLFTGEHGFRLEASGDDRVRFVQDETFRGLLVPIYSWLRLPATRRGFSQLNEALRERAEALARAEAGAPATEADHQPVGAGGQFSSLTVVKNASSASSPSVPGSSW